MTHLQSHISVHTVPTIITERPDKVSLLHLCQKGPQILLPMKEIDINSILSDLEISKLDGIALLAGVIKVGPTGTGGSGQFIFSRTI